MIARESLPSGNKRFADMREGIRLEKERINAKDSKKKQEISAEIRKLGVRVSK
jgi:hypothetical protein